MRAVAVIPARFGSSRFPGKPLASLLGKPMIAWVVEAAQRARLPDAVYVATDHDGISAAAQAAGAQVVMTSPHCASGTDRVAEVATAVDAEVFVNLQGDEPLVDPRDIDALVAVFASDAQVRMATLARPARDQDEVADPNAVKVVCDRAGDALYFSRAAIPHHRDGHTAADGGEEGRDGIAVPAVHLGLYAFRREALLAFAELPPGQLEQAEKLEQLRALEAGWKIRVIPARGAGHGVDAPADLARVEQLLRRRGAAG